MADYIKKQVRAFLKDKSKREVRIKYKGPRLNAAFQWWRYRNPVRMLWTSFIVEVCRKLPPCELKNHLYRMIGVKIGKDVTICPDVVLDWLFPELIEIDDGALLGADIWVACHSITIDELRIGRVRVGKQVLIASWTGNEPPTEYGDQSIVGVYTYVNKDVPPRSFCVGIPMQVKRELPKDYLQEFNAGLKKRR